MTSYPSIPTAYRRRHRTPVYCLVAASNRKEATMVPRTAINKAKTFKYVRGPQVIPRISWIKMPIFGVWYVLPISTFVSIDLESRFEKGRSKLKWQFKTVVSETNNTLHDFPLPCSKDHKKFPGNTDARQPGRRRTEIILKLSQTKKK